MRKKKQNDDKTFEDILLASVARVTPIDSDDSDSVVTGDPLRAKQREVTSKMRTSLIACSETGDLAVARNALNNITTLRIYHQISRIIRYTELMDKLEDKLYESMEFQISTLDTTDLTSAMLLMKMQANLQQSMIESQKLLQPYLDIAEMLPSVEVQNDDNTELHILPKSSRDKIRIAAQAVLSDIQKEQKASEG